MPLILPGNVASATAATTYSIANSCRFATGDGASMERTFGSAGTLTKWTFSCWFKRGKLSSQGMLFEAGKDGNEYTTLTFNSDNVMELASFSTSGYDYRLETTQQFRDVSAWYHVIIAFDTTQGTNTNRIKMYINGAQVTAFDNSTYPAEDYEDKYVNAAYAHGIGAAIIQGEGASGAESHYDGYIAEVVFIDGTAYGPTDLGEFDSDSPTIWKPKDPSGLTFGTNGFYLDFEASGNLGNDANGGTDLAETNLAAADQSSDSPTNNFANLNPLDNYYQAATFTEGNCKIVTGGSSVYAPTFSTLGMTAGKWYCEMVPVVNNGADEFVFGIASVQVVAANVTLGRASAHDWGYYADNGQKYNDGTASYGDSYTVDDIIGIALDLDNNKLYFAKNNTWQDSGDPTSGATGTGAISITAPASTPLGAYFFACAYYGNAAGTIAVNFGGCPAFTVSSAAADGNGYGAFEYAPPSGYLALCTKNLGSDGG